jgi:hypothetical protein
MFRNVLCAMMVMSVSIGMATAEDFLAKINKLEKDTLSFTKFTIGDKKVTEGDVTSLPIPKDVKVFTGKFNPALKKMEEGAPLEGGLSNLMFKVIPKFGIMSTISVSDDGKTITKLIVLQGMKK